MNTIQSERSIRDTVFEIVATQGKVDIGVLKPESTLRDLGIASLTAIEVLFEIEERFDIDFPEQGADLNDGTLQHLIEAVQVTVAAKKPHAG
jgi:acyl carrier protein